jgi:hypothetical protein
MANLAPKRVLTAQERKDGTWYVNVDDLDAHTEHIGDFVSETDAQDWIIQNSAAYFSKRDGH